MIYSFRDENYFSISQCYDRTFIPNHLMPEIHKHGGFEIMYIVNGNVSVEFFDGESNALDEVYHLFPGRFHLSRQRAVPSAAGVRDGRAPRQHRGIAHPRAAASGAALVGTHGGVRRKTARLFPAESGDVPAVRRQRFIQHIVSFGAQIFCRSAGRGGACQPAVRAAERRCRAVSENLRSYRGHAYIKKAIFLIENVWATLRPTSWPGRWG